MKKPALLFLLIICTLSGMKAQDSIVSYVYDPSAQPAEKTIRLTKLQTDLKIDPYKKRIDARVSLSFTPLRPTLDSLYFDLAEVKINSIKMGEKELKYARRPNGYVIFSPFVMYYGRDYVISFDYVAEPAEGINFIGWDDPKGLQRKQIWAHRPNGWLPYTEGIVTVDAKITFDNKYKVFSNGIRQETIQNADSTITWHYVMPDPHPFFSTALVIGDYKYKESRTAQGLPLEFWYYPDREFCIEPTYRYTEQMFDFFEKEIGVFYPWSCYREAPVVDYLYGAMETTTSTVYADFFLVDNRGFLGRNFVNVNAHELAHQWFGNYVVHLSNKHVWLTESFGTYYAKLFEKSVFGDEYYQNERNNELIRTLAASERDSFPLGHGSGGTDRWYPKGSLVIDMLRYVMGESSFRIMIRNYLEKHPNQVVETNDLLQSIRETTGMSLDWFFDEWIYRPGEPHYKVSYRVVKDSNRLSYTKIYVNQIHKMNQLTGPFKMPVVIEVHYRDGSVDAHKYIIEKKETEIDVLNRSKKSIAFVLFDPNRQVVKKLTFDRPFHELENQAIDAANMIDRYDALVAMTAFPLVQKMEVFKRIYDREEFQLFRVEIVRQLSLDSSNSDFELIKRAIADDDAKVRLSVLKNYTVIPPVLRLDFEKLLADSAYYIVEMALNNLSSNFPEYTPEYLVRTKDETGWRGRNIRIRWLAIALRSGLNEHLTELIEYAGPSYEFETRINAIGALKALNYLDDILIKYLFDGAFYWNYRLANEARSALKYYYGIEKYRQGIDAEYKSRKWKKSEQLVLDDLFKKQP
jgi:aminopeptidase N